MPVSRMSWLSKLNPRGVATRARRSVSQHSPVTADPETCLMVFKNHWTQVLWILEKSETRQSPVAADDLTAVRNYTDQMMYLLAEERTQESGTIGPILEFVVLENVLHKLLVWHQKQDFSEEKKVELLKLYEMLIIQSHQPMLKHKAIVVPLMRLLSTCSEPTSSILESNLVLLLNQLCVSMAREPSILELFFHSPATDQGPTNLLIFSLLVPFIHRDGVIGQQARDALLLIMAMSASNHTIASYITDHSYFCPVSTFFQFVDTGLQHSYSSIA
ncbi:FHF complex subunit HOOK interacting protein 1B-like [Protopterus annectens]|uniref:FHF complex subunit HOOK interacting protein 1B-like n=1 Tax=Protopterus annectens TaxID=7888 RepID=UPI001CFB79E6|nr:FHF complex subunit HOOK interacting protein 1B-like [Protopterus annectens]